MKFKSPVDGLSIDYSVYTAKKEKNRMLFLTGRAEYYRKYEFLYKLLNEHGITVYAMDHRGQGHSGRMLEDPQVGHVEKFSHYVDDAEFFLKNHVLNEIPSGVMTVSLSHSMGGAVSLLLGMRGTYFDRMIFSSPMWGINTGWLSHRSAFVLSKVFCIFGKAKDFVIRTGPDDLSSKFVSNRLTHSEKRFEAQKEYLKAHPEAVLGGPSNNWVHESLEMCNRLEKLDYSDMSADILLLQAENEMVVDNFAQNEIINRIPNSQKVPVKGAFHEILNESENIFENVLKEILSFLKK